MVEPLRWPENFPPRAGLKRFFVGVRWIGPDLSFFEALREEQGKRDRACLSAWGDDAKRRKLSRIFSAFFNRRVGWPSRYFIPDDSFATCMNGPKLNELGNDASEAFQELLLERFEIAVSDAELERLAEGTFGELVDHFVQKRAELRR